MDSILKQTVLLPTPFLCKFLHEYRPSLVEMSGEWEKDEASHNKS